MRNPGSVPGFQSCAGNRGGERWLHGCVQNQSTMRWRCTTSHSGRHRNTSASASEEAGKWASNPGVGVITVWRLQLQDELTMKPARQHRRLSFSVSLQAMCKSQDMVRRLEVAFMHAAEDSPRSEGLRNIRTIHAFCRALYLGACGSPHQSSSALPPNCALH